MTKKDIDKKRIQEKAVLTNMIALYCRAHHQTDKKGSLCDECNELLSYSLNRVDVCPLMHEKTFCQNCRVHCYQPQPREKIRTIMRYSGPRMIFRHPIKTLHHVILSLKERHKLNKQK